MATIDQVKDLLKCELNPIKVKLEKLAKTFNDLNTSVNFLKHIRSANEKLNYHSADISKIKEELKQTVKQADEANLQADELAQYLRDCLEISGIKATNECSSEAIVKSIGKAIDVPIEEQDISIAHPIPSYKTDAPPKIIVKFTRRSVRNEYYSNRRKLVNKKVKDLPDLNLTSNVDAVYISESLTPTKKKLFGKVNKVKKRLKWKFIWTRNGRILIKESETKPTYAFDTEEDLTKFENEHQ